MEIGDFALGKRRGGVLNPDQRRNFKRLKDRSANINILRQATAVITEQAKKNKSYSMGGSATYSRSKKRIGRVRRRTVKSLFKNYVGNQQQHIWRWASMSNNLKGPGRLPIAYGASNANPNNIVCPIYFMSLSSLYTRDNEADNSVYGAYKHGLCNVVYIKDKNQFFYLPKAAMTYAGNNLVYDGDGKWQPEIRSSSIAQPHKLFHKWTEVRFNLYGSSLYPLTYTITICKMPESWNFHKYPPYNPTTPDSASLIEATTEVGEIARDLLRPLVGNPINTNNTNDTWRNKVKIIRQYKYHIAPLSYSDADAEGTAAVHLGNTKQVKIFLRHDMHRRYDWAVTPNSRDYDKDFSDLGWDVLKRDVDPYVVDVDWNRRLYMYLTCTTSGLIQDQSLDPFQKNPIVTPTALPDEFGSFDIQVRRSFANPLI